MIRTLEQHLAGWMKGELDLLAADSPLFPAVSVAAGSDSPQPGNGQVGVQVTALTVSPVEENRDLGPAPATTDDWFRARVGLRLRFSGTGDPVGEDPPDLAVTPATAELHRVDLVALAVLARLRQRPLPGPDGAGGAGATGPGGSAEAVAGTRRTKMTWQDIQVGEAFVTEEGNSRTWEVPATALATFRLSPRPLEGGRILSVTVERDGTENVAAYAPAERLPLGYFRDLPGPLLTELAGHGLHTLGDVGRLGVAGVGLLAPALSGADAAAVQMLADLASISALRAGAAGSVVPVDPALLALPASALLAPTAAEQLVLDQWLSRPEAQLQVATLGMPVALYLQPPQRAVVRLGHLLARERGAGA